MRTRTGLLLLFALASFAAVASGSVILALAGSGPGLWVRNPVAWIVGALLALAASRIGRARLAAPAILLIAVLGTASTLVAQDVEGVNRWLDAGPLHINMAALLLPIALVALARLGLFTAIGTAFAAIVLLILIVQPDASQATAVAIAVVILAARQQSSTSRKIATAAFAVLTAVAAWLRPDPLQPVAEVELIFCLAADLSLMLAVVAVAALTAACLCPFVAGRDQEPTRSAALALLGYFAATAAAPALGAFPVPLVGLGMSFPVGFWLGIGLLSSLRAPAAGVSFEQARS